MAADIKSVEAQATTVIYVVYGKSQSCTFMTECRVKVWCSKTSSKKGWGIISKTMLSTKHLPLLHLFMMSTCATYKFPHGRHLKSPQVDPIKYGWVVAHRVSCFADSTTDAPSVPPDMPRLIDCNCKTSGCRTALDAVAPTRMQNILFM